MHCFSLNDFCLLIMINMLKQQQTPQLVDLVPKSVLGSCRRRFGSSLAWNGHSYKRPWHQSKLSGFHPFDQTHPCYSNARFFRTKVLKQDKVSDYKPGIIRPILSGDGEIRSTSSGRQIYNGRRGFIFRGGGVLAWYPHKLINLVSSKAQERKWNHDTK